MRLAALAVEVQILGHLPRADEEVVDAVPIDRVVAGLQKSCRTIEQGKAGAAYPDVGNPRQHLVELLPGVGRIVPSKTL